MERPFEDDRPIGPFVGSSRDSSSIKQYDRNVEPLVVLRDFHSSVNSGIDERTFMPKWGRFKYRKSPVSIIGEFSFHETSIDDSFNFKPMSQPNGGNQKQGTAIRQLGGKAGRFGHIFQIIFGADFDFAELQAASQGHQYLTDYEFEYEIMMNPSEVVGIDLDERIRDTLG